MGAGGRRSWPVSPHATSGGRERRQVACNGCATRVSTSTLASTGRTVVLILTVAIATATALAARGL